MKVAFISFAFSEYSVRTASALANYCEKVLLIMPDELDIYREILDPRVQLSELQMPRLRQLIKQVGVVQHVRKLIDAFQPDLIHLQQGQLFLNFALPFMKSCPLVITIHDPIPHVGDRESQKTPHAVYHFGFKQARELICHGREIKRVAVEQLGLPADHVHFVPMIKMGTDNYTPERSQTNGAAAGPIILFFGRIWEYKGLDYLIRAEPLITSQVPDARIMIAGRGEDFDRYRKMMVNPDHFIIDNDFIPDSKIAEYFSNASVVALPYIDASQTAVAPIAYSFEKPVVATTVGGLPDLIEDGKTGLLVPPRNEKALAEAIVRLLKSPELAASMGKAGKIKIDTESAPDTVARMTFDVYKRALSSL
jgi:glycosyltransferase involved in cell wall biosynthesis